MATHDYVIDNQTAPNFRADLNNALLAIVSNNSSATAPAVTYANMMWYDTATNILYMRNEDNDAWIALGTLDQTADTFSASVALASQAEAEAGNDNTKVMTPLRVAQAIPARFSNVFSANGQSVMPAGLIIKWGLITVGAGTYATVSFPTAFPNSCLNVQATIESGGLALGNKTDYAFVRNLSSASFQIGVGSDGSYTVRWQALGF